jgi:hypothetical protein
MILCQHPYDHIDTDWVQGTQNPRVYQIYCKVCRTPLGPKDDFEQIREDLYKQQVGWPVVWKDFLGNEIRVGSRVVYPVMSGRSAQMTEGVVEAINPPTSGTTYFRGSIADRIDAPDRIKIMPTGRSARWNQYYSGTHGAKIQKAVTLSANAASVVVVG